MNHIAPIGVSADEDERRLRIQLAECYHLVDFFGWTESVFNHISVRLPGEEKRYLVNPFGLSYSEVTPDNLLTVSAQGKIIGNPENKPNPAGFALHGAIHEAREDIHCLIHTHTTPICAVAMKQAGFSHDNFYGAQLYGRVAYHDFEGITLHDDERPRMVASFGDKHVLVLRNHGIAVGEIDIPTTFMLLWSAQRAAEIQCASGTIPGPDVILSEAVRQSCVRDAQRIAHDAKGARYMFAAETRRMRKARGPLWEGDTAA